MKKTLIALAIAGVSFNAAAVNLDTDADVAKFASEIKVDGSAGTPLGTVTGNDALKVSNKLGFAITNTNKRYIRYDVVGGTLFNVAKGDFKFESFWTNAQPPVEDPVTATFAISQVGPKNEFVIVEVNATEDIPANAVVMFDADNRVKVTSKSGVTISYRLFETALDAVANDPSKALHKENGQLLSFAPAILAKVAKKGATDKVDVKEASKKFISANGNTLTATTLGEVSVIADTSVRLATGTNVTATNNILSGGKLIVNGSFSAGAVTDGKLGLDTVKLNNVNAAKVEAGKAELTVADTGIPANNGKVDYAVAGKTAIDAPVTYTATFVPTVKDGFELGDIPLNVIGELVKNGDSKEANLVLAPDTSYNNLVRISNTSSAAGKFFITVTADDGTSKTFPLSAVAGQPAELAAGASTKQMKVADIYAAAAAEGLTVTGEKKLRLKVEGEVSSLSLQNYTISKDGNALSTMNAF